MSVIRWVGGKTKLLPEILRRLPSTYDTWLEPFLGSGAVLMAAEPQLAIVADACEPLITFYRVLIEQPVELHNRAKWLVRRHTEKAYYDIRDLFNELKGTDERELDQAALFWYLNRTNFNGLYRENNSGEFNASCGCRDQDVRTAFIADLEVALEFSHRLQTLLRPIFCESWEWVTAEAIRDDFVYLDPPYFKESETANFGQYGYSADRFGPDDHSRLARACHKLHGRGAMFMLHNSDTERVRELWARYTIDEVSRPGTVNSKASKRGRVGELIIRNYET